MVRRQASTSTTTSSIPVSRALHDEGSRLWHYRDFHAVSGTSSVNRNKARKNPRVRRRTKNQKREKPGNAVADDKYYLRWNPSGDYDSDDDDWWKEVMAMERKDHNKHKKKEKKAAASAAKQEEATLYLKYKYHTTKVMEWGNSFWVDRDYCGTNGEGDGVAKHHISLRTMVGRLNDLAHDDIPMPAAIHLNLKHAIDLREEFQIRYVSQRKSQEGGKEVRKTRRSKNNAAKPSASVSPLSRNSGSTGTSSDDGVDNGVDTIEDGTSKNPIRNSTKDDTTSVTATMDNNHRWILDQLKALLNRFHTEPNSKNIVSDNTNDDHCSVEIETEASGDSKNSCCERSHKALTVSLDRNNDNDNDNPGDKNCDESSVLDPSKEDDVGAIMILSCISSSSMPAPSPVYDKNQCTDIQYSGWNSNSSSENWDKIFGDDGSLIGSHESSDECCHSQTRDPDLVSSIAAPHEDDEDESQNSSNPEMLQRDDHLENEKSDSCQTPRTAKTVMSSDTKESRYSTVLVDNGIALSNPSNNSILRNLSPRNINRNPSNASIKIKGLLPQAKIIPNDSKQQKPQRQMIEIQNNGTMILERPPTSLNATILATNKEIGQERLQHSNQFDSVWDVPFFIDEEASTAEYTIGRPVQTDVISLSNSEPPEDWEMLLEEEDEEKDTVTEEARSQLERAEREMNYSLKVALSPKELGVQKLEVSSCEKNGTKNKHPNKNSHQDVLNQLLSKPKKSAYSTTDNLRYDSVWDIFAKEMPISSTQVVDDDAITKSTISIVQDIQPEDNWEDLYLFPQVEKNGIENKYPNENKLDKVSISPKRSGVQKLEVSPCQKNGTKTKHPNKNSHQDILDENLTKREKPAYAIAENLRYDSIWDMFAEEKPSSSIVVADKGAIAKSAISIIGDIQPENDWEALYSFPQFEKNGPAPEEWH